MSADQMSPDCLQSKHRACSGDAWDHETDEPAACACGCHTEEMTA